MKNLRFVEKYEDVKSSDCVIIRVVSDGYVAERYRDDRVSEIMKFEYGEMADRDFFEASIKKLREVMEAKGMPNKRIYCETIDFDEIASPELLAEVEELNRRYQA